MRISEDALSIQIVWSTYINKLLLILLRHISQAIVFSSKVSFQPSQRSDHDIFYFSPLCPRTGWGKAETSDTATSTYT